MVVAVCDDDIKFCKGIYELIIEYAKKEHKRIFVDVFQSGSDLLKNMKSGQYYDLVFLDIELKNDEYGNDIGNYIRNVENNQTTSIVYISSYTSYAVSLFSSRPLDFIEKPITQEKIDNVFNLYDKIKNSDDIKFEIKNRTSVIYVLYRDILYFTRELRKLIVVTNNMRYECYANFNLLKETVGFIKINQSYIINVNYIKRYTYRSIELTNGDILSISQPYRNNIKKYLDNTIDL